MKIKLRIYFFIPLLFLTITVFATSQNTLSANTEKKVSKQHQYQLAVPLDPLKLS